ncbi:rhodanese-like domain-containing protein [Bacillus sp. B15-48]|uniref:rhodanese-like domain-containing protein n=1 Tax=Bacillus sp. B15-48 TaxID=1548601 RepID=UPI00193FB497|nr:rhodanese-like domain-containing protein [Bacillus sp. B15-48]MBM4765182.1 rhodanese-like domain-containing protein [Bacillus sp. B15-48]
MKVKKILLALVILVVLTACNIEGYENISITEAKQLIDDSEVTILDVRTPEEYNEGHIPNATLLPLQELEGRLNELNKEETFLIVCRSGNRSTQASKMLTEHGFANVYNMTGGMNDWTYEVIN